MAQGAASPTATSFTPALKFGGASTGITYSQQLGRYWKIGNLVFFQIYLILTSKGSATGTATIGGLPFTSNASVPAGIFPAVLSGTSSLTGAPNAAMVQNTTSINLQQFVSNATANLTDANFTNTSVIEINGFYASA